MKALLELSNVGMKFDTPKGTFEALKDVNLKIADGEFVSLIGHSGCGKSTVLNIVAGLLQATDGGVILDKQEVTEPGPERAVVFQNHSLLPWLTAFENVELAVKQVFKKTKSRAEIRDWVEHNLELVHMAHAMHKKPDEISGGMKQRVGIARALAMQPQVLLMDEPFGALDEIVRDHLNEQLLKLWARTEKTIGFVTHSIPEAVYLSTRIVVMSPRPGRITDVIENDLPKERPLDIRDTPEFLEIAHRVREGLRAGHAYDD